MDLCVAVSPMGWVPVAERAERLARLGFSCLEVTWANFPHWDPSGCREVRAGMESAGVSVNSVHLPFGGEINVLSSDPGLRLHALEAHRSVVAGSALLGAQTLVMHPGREYKSDRPLADVLSMAVESAREVTLLAAGLGLQVALENVLPAHVLSSHALLREIVEAVAMPELGFCLDTGHANVVDSVDCAMECFAGRIKHVHIHDNHGQADEHLMPSLGSIRWEGFVDRLRATGFAGPLTLECYPPQGLAPEDVLPTVRRALGLDR